MCTRRTPEPVTVGMRSAALGVLHSDAPVGTSGRCCDLDADPRLQHRDRCEMLV